VARPFCCQTVEERLNVFAGDHDWLKINELRRCAPNPSLLFSTHHS
jgi:hypothetical protein